MIRSMTGYNRARLEDEGFALSISIKSANNRYLDLHLRLPGVLEPLEPVLRNVIKRQVARGHLDIVVNLERKAESSPRIERRLLDAYLKTCLALRAEFGLTGEPDLVALLRIPGVVIPGNGEVTPEEFDRFRGTLEKLTQVALEGFNRMREAEGQALELDLRNHLSRIRSLADESRRLAEGSVSAAQRKIEEELHELLKDAQLDPARLAQEAAFLATRSDISEELTRLGSHLDQAQGLLTGGAEVGRKLDFLLQEMNREANTVLSKTSGLGGLGLELTLRAIEIKAEVEKLREQAQNIE